ncbi:Transcription factor [Penicillium brevicompactum]|uniref:Transcription factor n=1 Tax=Penicillium brevicompactum TaxID=5074 RepID=UPI002540B489|nr:Transcription factor [Penicillium brevicompactum]KAJ5343699.1 Transcription factor [Penicillium brevicompactum]
MDSYPPVSRVGHQSYGVITLARDVDAASAAAFVVASKSLNNDETWTRKKVSVSAGFLGQTSYSDVFTDATSGLSTGRLHVVDQDTIPVDSRRINLGAQVLALLENLPFYREVITARFKVWKGWTIGWKVTDMVLTVVEEMWNSYEREEMDTMPRAVLMSRRLFETHTRSFDITSSTTWEEFQITASGRWETIGLLFTLVGVATDLVSHDHPLFTDPDAMDASTLANTASAVGDICLQFCDNSGIINDISTAKVVSSPYPSRTVMICLTLLPDFRPWRKLGELSTTVFALGLHQDSSSNAPFFLAELRRRTMVAAFTVDKVLATFLGRPPLISWRFCNISMPLDLSMEEVFAEPAVRDAAIAQLDANTGWNQEGTLKKVHGLGLLLLQVELAQESRRLRNALPEFLRWKPDGDGVGISRIEDAFLFELDLEFLHNDFLLYRTLGQRTQTKPQEIIETSREILKALILMVSKIIRWGQSVSGAGWVFQLCLPGLPCAGVLSAELLRQSRSTIPASSSNFPRSEIIQNLTLYASYLDTMIRPDEGNHRLAQQGQKAIRHVLDQVLSAEQLPPAIDGNDWSDIVARNDDNIFDGMNVDDNGLLFSLVDGSMQQMSDSWLTWVNFT